MQTPTRFNSPALLQASGTGTLVKFEAFAALQAENAKLRQEVNKRNPTPDVKVSLSDTSSFIEIKGKILSICAAADFGASLAVICLHVAGASRASIRLCINSLVHAGKIRLAGINYYEVVK